MTLLRGTNLKTSSEGYYEITDEENLLVKKIGSYNKNDFIRNLDIESLEDEYCMQNTKVLHAHLKAKGYSVTRKKTKHNMYLDVNDFRIQYISHGYRIKDLLNFSHIENTNDYHNDYSTPEKVEIFLEENEQRLYLPDLDMEAVIEIEQGVSGKGKSEWQELKESAAEKLAGKGWDIKVEEIPESLDEIAEHTKLQIKNFKQGAIDLKEVKKRVYKNIPCMSIKTRVGKLLNKLHKKNWKKIREEVVTEILKGTPKVRAPKFTGFNDLDDKIFRIHHNKRDNTVEYWCSKNGYESRREFKMHQFLWRNVLHSYPKAMPLLMQIASGKMKDYYFDELFDESFLLEDPYTEYRKATLDKPINERQQRMLEYCCEDILATEEIETALNFNYEDKFAKGTKVKVEQMEPGIYEAIILSCDYGVEVRYEDGTVAKPRKNQRIRLYDFK
jgi:hypothetical protein